MKEYLKKRSAANAAAAAGTSVGEGTEARRSNNDSSLFSL